ncbi:MAG: 5-deoxy-glucuronate isomerase [Chloroflexota bacterium]|nr:5-deoxy-glucuronate isomerase [Chloroflexota bacterium]
MSNHLKSKTAETIVLDVTPESANWQYLSFRIVRITGHQAYLHNTERTELALVPLEGAGTVQTGAGDFALRRAGVFVEKPSVLYLPPGQEFGVITDGEFEFAIGAAPAEGRYPLRLFAPDEIRAEVRGGGAARRQVHHTLAHPLPAERLILYEVYVPGGAWSGYPPHCHDGYGGSAHLDETYYFRTEPANGVALHRNYRRDEDFEEIFAVRNRDLVLVTQGFHSTAAAPGSNLYFLNYLAGELIDDDRKTPPYDDPDYAWLKEDYTSNRMRLPLMG